MRQVNGSENANEFCRASLRSALPNGWSRVTLSEIALISTGTTPLRSNSAYYSGGTIPWVSSSAVNDTTICRTDSYVTQKAFDETSLKLYPAGTLLVALYGEGKTRGKCSELAFSSTINQALAAIVLKDKAREFKPFIKWFLISRYEQIRRPSSGGVQPNLNLGLIRKIEVPLAPIGEQERIVAAIEAHLTRLDAGVANLQRVRAKLKRCRAAVLKAACEGRLVPTEAELARAEGRSYEPADRLLNRILQERRERWEADQLSRLRADGKRTQDDRWRQRYREPAEPSTTTLTELPEGWKWASVEGLSTKVVDGVHKKPEYVASGVPFVTVRNMTAGPGLSFERVNFITKQDHNEFTKRANPEAGDLLISKDGTLGVVRVVPEGEELSIFVSVALIKPVERRTSSYMAIALESPQVQMQMVPKGTGLQHIHLEDLREDCVPVPPLEEQFRIVSEVQRRLSLIDGLDAVVADNLKRADRLKQSILKHAFEGKLVPRDPNDEPAAALLERITGAERQAVMFDAAESVTKKGRRAKGTRRG